MLQGGMDLEAITKEIDEPEAQRKIFIGGLKTTTTEKHLYEAFQKYGNLIDVCVIRGPNYKPRGFGFVTFSKAHMMTEVFKDAPDNRFMVDGKYAELKKVIKRQDLPPTTSKPDVPPEADENTTRIFVGGVPEITNDELLKEHFGKFGDIEDIEIPLSEKHGKPRGFAFITFGDKDSVDQVVAIKYHYLKGKKVEVKKAIEKEKLRRNPLPADKVKEIEKAKAGSGWGKKGSKQDGGGGGGGRGGGRGRHRGGKDRGRNRDKGGSAGSKNFLDRNWDDTMVDLPPSEMLRRRLGDSFGPGDGPLDFGPGGDLGPFPPDFSGSSRDFPGPGRDFPGPGRDFPGPGRDFPGPGRDFPGAGRDFPGPGQDFPMPGRDFPGPGPRGLPDDFGRLPGDFGGGSEGMPIPRSREGPEPFGRGVGPDMFGSSRDMFPSDRSRFESDRPGFGPSGPGPSESFWGGSRRDDFIGSRGGDFGKDRGSGSKDSGVSNSTLKDYYRTMYMWKYKWYQMMKAFSSAKASASESSTGGGSRDSFNLPGENLPSRRGTFDNPRESFSSQRSSFGSSQDSFSSNAWDKPRESLSSPRDNFSSSRDNFSNPRDTFSNLGSNYGSRDSSFGPMKRDTQFGGLGSGSFGGRGSGQMFGGGSSMHSLAPPGTD